MKKNKLPYIAIILSAIFILVGISIYLSVRNGSISIKNNTDITISGLKIKYGNFTTDVEIPTIQQKQTQMIKIKLPENFTEGSIRLCYTDKQGKSHEEYLEGYIEKAYNGRIIVNINSVDGNGILSIKVKEHRFI